MKTAFLTLPVTVPDDCTHAATDNDGKVHAFKGRPLPADLGPYWDPGANGGDRKYLICYGPPCGGWRTSTQLLKFTRKAVRKATKK